MNNLTPQAIVLELSRYIVGQNEAKKAVAIALCNRERRKKLPLELQGDLVPKNVLFVGPTGSGKTELAHRTAMIVAAPFLKVEASRFTEVGYVGRDVESIIHELVEAAVVRVYEEKLHEAEHKAEHLATERIISYLCQQLNKGSRRAVTKSQRGGSSLSIVMTKSGKPTADTRRKMANLLDDEQLEEQVIEIDVDNEVERRKVAQNIAMGLDAEEIGDLISEMSEGPKCSEKKCRRRKVPVKEARRILTREEAARLLNFDEVIDEAVVQTEERGIVFIDEIDKLVGPRVEIGRDISGEGVQRDLLPLIEGMTVLTKYGVMKSNHILFITAGTFSQSKPSDLMPELLGRFPIQVKFGSLSEGDMEQILTCPQNALTKQYQALLATEGLDITFTPDGVHEIAHMAAVMNELTDNIGARRLHTIMEKTMEELNFTAAERRGENVVVDAEYVRQRTQNLVEDNRISHYVL